MLEDSGECRLLDEDSHAIRRKQMQPKTSALYVPAFFFGAFVVLRSVP
jgi:hypothetical protein